MKKDQHLGSESQRSPKAPVLVKKSYVSPELQEWGSVLDLTQGKKAQLVDAPAKGGSSPI